MYHNLPSHTLASRQTGNDFKHLETGAGFFYPGVDSDGDYGTHLNNARVNGQGNFATANYISDTSSLGQTIDWTMTLLVSDPLYVDGDEEGTVTQVSGLYISKPETGDNPGFCLTIFYNGLEQGPTDEAREVGEDDREDGCEMIDEECRSALLELAAEGKDEESCTPGFELPEVCSESMGANAGVLSQWFAPDAEFDYYVFGQNFGPFAEGSDEADEAYKYAVGKVWPVLYNNQVSREGANPLVASGMTCIRATDFPDGALDPFADDTEQGDDGDDEEEDEDDVEKDSEEGDAPTEESEDNSKDNEDDKDKNTDEDEKKEDEAKDDKKDDDKEDAASVKRVGMTGVVGVLCALALLL